MEKDEKKEKLILGSVTEVGFCALTIQKKRTAQER
jgi:hypothetical protein